MGGPPRGPEFAGGRFGAIFSVAPVTKYFQSRVRVERQYVGFAALKAGYDEPLLSDVGVLVASVFNEISSLYLTQDHAMGV